MRLTRHTFALNWPATLYGAWLVLRANQLWAPDPENDPEGRAALHAVVLRAGRAAPPRAYDVDEAARLEVEWWRVHRTGSARRRTRTRTRSTTRSPRSTPTCTACAARRCSWPPQSTRARARSDRGVDDGCDPESPALTDERAMLVRSYAALLAAVHR